MTVIARKADGRRIFTAEFKQQQVVRVQRGELSTAELSWGRCVLGGGDCGEQVPRSDSARPQESRREFPLTAAPGAGRERPASSAPGASTAGCRVAPPSGKDARTCATSSTPFRNAATQS